VGGVDFWSCAAFVFAVVPLDKIAVNFSHWHQSRRVTVFRARCSGLVKTLANLRPGNTFAELSRILLATFGQWRSGEAGNAGPERLQAFRH